MSLEKITFNKRKVNKEIIRKKFCIDHDEDDHTETIESMKEYQSLRKKPRGLSLETYSVEDEEAKNIEIGEFSSVKIGGLFEVASQFLKKDEPEDDFELNIGTAFSKETNKKEDFTEMMKFIEEELSKRKQIDDSVRDEKSKKTTLKLYPNDAFYYLSEHLKKTYVENKKNKSEEMLSNQMLSGIPEVNLGLEIKMANIQATELEKQKVIDNKGHQFNRQRVSSFVPTNVAVNYVQHNRYNMESDKTFYISKDLSVPNYDKHSPHHIAGFGGGNVGTGQNALNQQQLTNVKSEPTVKIDDTDFFDKEVKFEDKPTTVSKDSPDQKINKNSLEELENIQFKKPPIYSYSSSSSDHKTKTSSSKRSSNTKIHKEDNYRRINPERATDDFYYEKFRKQFSRR